jgi:hypothetical protein
MTMVIGIVSTSTTGSRWPSGGRGDRDAGDWLAAGENAVVAHIDVRDRNGHSALQRQDCNAVGVHVADNGPDAEVPLSAWVQQDVHRRRVSLDQGLVMRYFARQARSYP